MSAAFTLRAATPADIPAVMGIVRGLAEYERLEQHCTATEADFAVLLFGPDAIAYAALAEIDGACVGGALWYFSLSTFAGRAKLFVEDVFVQPSYRGHGIGIALFRHMAGIAQERDCWCMEWRVLNWNEPAIGFYQRIGARPVTDWTTQQLRGDALATLAARKTPP